MAVFYGYNPPFFGGPQNVLSRQEDERLIKNDILQLLLTVPGERVMRPEFGVHLRSAVFEQMDESETVQLESEIRDKLRQYEPRVIVQAVSVAHDESRNGIQVKVVAQLKRDPSKELSIEHFIAARV